MPIHRNSFKKLWGEVHVPEISIILGARQVGKSTLMHQLEADLRSQGRKTAFFDLEQPTDLRRLSGDDEHVIRELTQAAEVVFIDEFHYLKNASKIFKAMYDGRRSVKIFASGSSSLEIHKHLKESLAGRFRKTLLYPLLLAEWHQVPGFRDEEYLTWGGLPGLSHRPDEASRLELLENIVSTYITKDVKGLIKEENVRAFNTLLHVLAQSQGSVATAANLARETGLSESTVARHLELMCQTYVLYAITSYSSNLANELKKSKKYYLFDLGVRNLLLKDVRPAGKRDDKGVLYESAVLLHLIAQLTPNIEIRFWRTKRQEEVDFVFVKDRVPTPIEVKSNVAAPIVPEGVTRFLTRYSNAPCGVVFNATLDAQTESVGRPIYFRRWVHAERFDTHPSASTRLK